MKGNYISPQCEEIESWSPVKAILETSGSGIVDPIDGGEWEW